jgi:hypothetical protein
MQNIECREKLLKVAEAAQSVGRVNGLTHCHYKYPARFSPEFVATVIECLSQPGQLVLDPYMGGGTTIIEALARGRRVVGCDINSLSLFVTRVKTASLTAADVEAVRAWATEVVPTLSYRHSAKNLQAILRLPGTRNLHIPRARAVKKLIALAVSELLKLPTPRARDFARCVLLNVGQWALNGRKLPVSIGDVRNKVRVTAQRMLRDTLSMQKMTRGTERPRLIHSSAEHLPNDPFFRRGALVDLVVTSPPYPGIHMLYHRWQVDGRRETPAPYWIADCPDGAGASFYNFGGRHQRDHHDYFAQSLQTLKGIRSVMRQGGVIVQLIAFSEPATQLPRYLKNMAEAGFVELTSDDAIGHRTWRDVPSRQWYASLKGATQSSREVLLLHTAQ